MPGIESRTSIFPEPQAGDPSYDDNVQISPYLKIDPGEAPPLGELATPSGPASGYAVAGAGFSILGGLLKGMAAIQSGDANARVAERNAAFARAGAGDALLRGHIAAQYKLLRGSQMASKQTASYAGAGVDVTSGSVVETTSDTKGMSAFEALMAENDAARQAWGLGEVAKRYDREAELDRVNAQKQLGESILGGAAGAATIAREYAFKGS